MVAAALLEREEELAEIERVLASAAAGAGRVLTLEGAAGAGKTTLLDAAAGLGGERGLLVLRARGGEYERDFPYGVVRQLFEPVLAVETGRAELLGGAAAPAAPIFEPALAPADGTDPYVVQHGLSCLVAGLAGAQPLLISVDDVQWADLASLRALVYVGRRLDELPVAMALAVRSGEPGGHEELLDQLRREPNACAVEPSPLSAEAAASLAVGEGYPAPSEGFSAACREATAGNPFLLVELLRSLDLERVGDGESDPQHLAELAAAGASRPILARLARLGEHSVEVARAVAVLEPRAEARRIAALSGLPADRVTAACERLVIANLLSDTDPVGFVHPLVRAAVLGELPAPRRAADHARTAQLLARDGADGGAVAAHLLLAEPGGKGWAVAALRSAAAEALDRGAPEAAVSYLRRALREPPAASDRLAVSRELGIALLRTDEAEGIEILRAARAGQTDPVVRAEIATELAASIALRRPGESAAALLEESLAEIADWRSDTGLRLRAYLARQLLSGLERVPAGALPACEEDSALETFAGRLLLDAAAGAIALGLGKLDRGRRMAEQVLADAGAIEELALAGMPPHASAATLVLADRGEHAEGAFELALDVARRRGGVAGVISAHGIRAHCRFAEGDLRSALDDAQIALELLGQRELTMHVSNAAGAGVRSLVALGELERAEDVLEKFWRGRDAVPGVPGAAMLIARGELRHADGRPAEARHDFLAAAERLRWMPCPNPEVLGARLGLAEVELALENDAEARGLAADAVRLAREAGGERGVGVALRALGVVTEGDEGIERLRESVGLLAGTRARLQHARALVDLGAALRRANRRKEARPHLREGLDLAHRCGAVPLEERARTELAAAGARPRRAVLSGVESLTPSELRVARMAADGRTNREIAAGLVVTPKTVETHLRHVFQKLDVNRRTQLSIALGDDDPDRRQQGL